jgi:UrcA family protein
MKKVINRTLASAVIGIAAGFALNASAETIEVTQVTTSQEGLQQATISYDDLDLSSARGQEAMYFRISAAADQVCGSRNPREAGGITQATENKVCYKRAMSEAMSQLNASQVAAVAN